ncbi:MAG: nitrogenase component 1 [Bacillota bacterium]|nr:nitrogenase component 1 [Bacillota bacterium]
MAINLNRSEAVIREKRLKSIIGYTGTVKDILEKTKSGCLKNRSRSFTQTTNCSSGCAQFYLSTITDAAVVNHAPIGCLSDAVGADVGYKWGQNMRNWEKKSINVINTNMSEETTVFGGRKILKAAIFEAYRRFKPKAIFVTTSCASAIIGDDIDSLVQEAEEEIGIPVVPVFCEGFRSQIWASGFDAAFQALLTRIIKPPVKKRPELVNLINFTASGSEIIKKIFDRLGLVPQFGIPFSSIDEISRMSEAAATISVCGTLGGYFGNALEQKYGVPYVTALQPHGIKGIEDWLRNLGSILNKEKEVEEYISEMQETIKPELSKLREKLKGKRAVVGMGPSFSHNYIRLLEEFGIDVVWGLSWHYDALHDHGGCPSCTLELEKSEKDVNISVNDQQNHELVNILRKYKPDIFIGRHPGQSVWAIKMGIPSIMVGDEYSAFGYEGTIEFGYRILDEITNSNLAKNLSKRITLPYTEWWLEQEEFTFLEREAK